MSGPEAVVMHDLHGRTRLRIAEKRGDRQYFATVEHVLSQCPAVRHVSGSPLTGSVLLVHAGDFAEIARFVREQGIFEIVKAPEPDTFTSIQSEVRALDTKLRSLSNERVGVPAVTFYGLLGAGVWQLAQGRVLPPTVTLLFQALNVFKLALEAEQGTRSRLGRE